MTNQEKNSYGICSDHAGFELKEEIKKMLNQRNIACTDFGTYSNERADYPDFAHLLGQAIEEHKVQYGIAICGSGNGISMTLNKYPQVRAALCWNKELAQLARAHNDANVLSLPARFITVQEAEEILDAYLSSDFEGGRHTARVAKIPVKK